MRFWDSSAIVPLLVREAASTAVDAALNDDPEVVVWWATAVECASALARLEREEGLTHAEISQALQRLADLELRWSEVQPTEGVRAQATRLLRVHSLRASDALQLAAAITAAEHEPKTMTLVALDERVALAAAREGFVVAPPIS